MPSIDEVLAKAPSLGEGAVDGEPAWIVETLGEDGKPDKLWIGQQHGLPRQMLVDGKTIKLNYSRINEVPDSEFELPKGVTVQDMGGGLPGGR
jgi:hypothetical protein